MSTPPSRKASASRRVALALSLPVVALSAAAPASAAPPVLDLETLTAIEAQKLMKDGRISSVELTRAYIDRINALNKRGPGLNAVTQFNVQALREAAASDARRAAGELRGPADGLPVLMKDLIDVKGMYTSNGNYSLRNSFPEKDSGVAKHLRRSGAVILGKLGLSEYANYFGSQPSGFSNLLGQVLNGIDADQNPSGSSSGSGSASAAALSTLVIGTETSGSIISPSNANGIVGLRPTVGLVPGIGIGPIAASQDTAGPMDRTVSDAAVTLQAIAGYDQENADAYAGIWGPGVDDETIIPPVPSELPDYVSALDLDFVKGKRIGWNRSASDSDPTPPTPDTALGEAYAALVDAGAIMVHRPAISGGSNPAGVLPYEAHRGINAYYLNLGPSAPIKSLAEEIADNRANSHEALKFGNGTHATAEAIDISPDSAASVQYRSDLVTGKQRAHAGIDRMMQNDTPGDPSDDFIAILGTVNQGARAGYPQMTIPMGYSETTRRTLNVSIHANAYKERDLIGVGYVIEQGTRKRRPASRVNPSMYRCAKTVPAPPHAERGDCNPDYDTIMAKVGERPELGFSLETATVDELEQRMRNGSLTSEALTKGYLARIALTNAEGPATQAVRSVDLGAIDTARALDAERADSGPRGPLHGIPVIVDDSIDVAGVPTTAGSIALQDSVPTTDSPIVAKLKARGAIIIGKANVSELNGLFDGNMPEGYSSLGGQVLLPSDTDKTPAGSSAGSAAATASGLGALAVGLETSTDTAQLIAPAGVAGVVGLKPTVGRISRTGVLGVAKSQDAPGPIAKSVKDAALGLQVLAGRDSSDPATSGAPTPPDYLSGLRPDALRGKRIAVVSSSAASYPGVVQTLQDLGATTVVKTVGTPSPEPSSIVGREFKRDLNAYLSGVPGSGAKSLQQIIDYNEAHAEEGLKYRQSELQAAQAVDLSDDTTSAAYVADRDAGKASSQALIDEILGNGTPGDTSDDFQAVVVPSGNALVGIADRAGYPVLTVPAGYGTGSAGRNPIGVVFVGPAFGEAELLANGYAFEQARESRQAPSYTNPSMWRCVPGSTFFSPHHCHPGDRGYRVAFAPLPETPAEPGGEVPPTGEPTPNVSPPPTVATPPLAAPQPPVSRITLAKRSAVRATTLRRNGFLTTVRVTRPGRISVTLTRGSATWTSTTRTVRRPGTYRIRVRLSAAGKRALARIGSGRTVTLRITARIRVDGRTRTVRTPVRIRT